jgi:hypothetical protein
MGLLVGDERGLGGQDMQANSADYYRARERAERKAAAEAVCPQARRAHEELAQAYAQLIGEREHTTMPSPQVRLAS